MHPRGAGWRSIAWRAALALACAHAAVAAPGPSGRYTELDGRKAQLTIDCLTPGTACGRFGYETPLCQGGLVYTGQTATGYAFRTDLTTGRCLPGCTLEISTDLKRYVEVCRNVRHEGTLVAAEAPPAAPAGPTGLAHLTFPNGDVYDGQVVNGKRNGKGKMTWANGQSYDGDWRDDVAEGTGTLAFANGDRYTGEVHAGTPQGRGTIRYANGDMFEGRFEKGIPDVEGVYVEKDGSRYEGQWKAGVKHGRGKLAWASGQSYEGDWVAGKPEGNGRMTFANGDRYEGPVHDGLPHGKGVKVYASGDRYEGDFERGQAQGEGTMRWKSGDVYTGHWQNGKKVGAGRYDWATGDWWEGEFVDDKRTEGGRLYFKPRVAAGDAGGAAVAMAADALANRGNTGTPSSGPAKPGSGIDRTKLLAIPMVAREVRDCSRKQPAGTDCPARVVDGVLADSLQAHQWQTMASDKGTGGKASVFQVDGNSVLEGGNVYSWLRSGDGTQARNVGIKYDCRAQSLEIQLIYHCTADKPCVLDPNLDKYAGKVLPATDIKGWFKDACER